MSVATPPPATALIPQSLVSLAESIEGEAHKLALGGDELVSDLSLKAVKDLFDLGLSLENQSHPHLHPFVLSILQPPSISLRSNTKDKSNAKTKPKSQAEPEKEIDEAERVLQIIPYTPLSELTIDGLEVEQIWNQLEMRAESVGRVIKEIGVGGMGVEENEGEGGSSSEEEDDEEGDFGFGFGEEGDEEEMTEEEMERLMREYEEGGGSGSEESGSEESGSGSDDDDEDEDSDEEDDAEEQGSDLEMGSLSGSDDDLNEGSEGDDVKMSGEEDDDDDEEEEEDAGEEDDESDNEEDDDDENPPTIDDAAALFGNAPGPSRRKKHPELDDEFFSIDEFNRLTEEAEAGRVSSGRLGGGGDDDDEDEEYMGVDMGSLMLGGAGGDDEVMYGDFFEKPQVNVLGGTGGKGKGRGDGRSRASEGKGKGKRKGKGVMFADEADEAEEDEDEDEDEDEEEVRDVMGRVKGDLFDEESEEEEQEENLSNHQKRQLALAKQIAELEQEAIGPKDWTLLGEATSRVRPENSLLEEDLDFEHTAKVVPVVTEETVKTLEELIKRRILDNQFDSPIRVRAYEPTPFLPSRYFDLQDTQSAKSLAQIYEDDFTAAASGSVTKDPRDEKLKKEHEEIERIWGEVCYKLDALCSLNFVPKQPKAQITTIENIATTSMESALPTTSSTGTILAPEELFAPPRAKHLTARTELTPEEKQRARAKARKAKAQTVKHLGDMAELYGKKDSKGKGGGKGGKVGVREEKEKALLGLVKGGKGVTVVGKSGGGGGEGRKRKSGDQDGMIKEDGKRLKL